MGGKGGSSTTVQKADPWVGQQPFLSSWGQTNGKFMGTMPEAWRLYSTGQMAPDYYPGQTVADQSTGQSRPSKCRHREHRTAARSSITPQTP